METSNLEVLIAVFDLCVENMSSVVFRSSASDASNAVIFSCNMSDSPSSFNILISSFV